MQVTDVVVPPLGPFPTLSDLQLLELGCSRKKTLWERHQLVFFERPAIPQNKSMIEIPARTQIVCGQTHTKKMTEKPFHF